MAYMKNKLKLLILYLIPFFASADWLDLNMPVGVTDKSKEVLADPHRQNYKSALQEWTQSKGLSIPKYKTIEMDKQHDNPKRFFCTVFIQDLSIAEGWGKSMKQAEKDAANNALNSLDKNALNL